MPETLVCDGPDCPATTTRSHAPICTGPAPGPLGWLTLHAEHAVQRLDEAPDQWPKTFHSLACLNNWTQQRLNQEDPHDR